MLLYELLRGRITVNDNISNSNNISSNRNNYSTGNVASVTAPTHDPVVASGASADDSADEPGLAQQAATTATATTTTAAADATMQDRPLTTAVLVPSALSGESQSRTSADVAATSDDAVSGEPPAFNGEVFPGVDSDDDDNDQDSLIVGARTVLRPGSAELSSTVEWPPLASMSNSATTATTANRTSTAVVADSDGSKCSNSNDADCNSSSICITSADDHTSTNTISTSTSTSSSSSSNSNSSSSELTLNVPLQLHGRSQRSAELCRCVHATCIMHGMSEEHIAQQCNTVLLLQAEAENRDASLASVETVLIQWLSRSDSPLQPRHHIRQSWLVAIENKQNTLHKTRQVYVTICRHCLASAHLLSKRKGAVSYVHVMFCVCIKALTTVMLHTCAI
jgi:hypothetical protein